MEIPFGGNLAEDDRKVRHSHLPFEGLPQRPPCRTRNERYAVIRSIKRLEKGYSLNMIPVEMGKKYFRVNRLSRRSIKERLAQGADAAARVEDDGIVLTGLNLKAGG